MIRTLLLLIPAVVLAVHGSSPSHPAGSAGENAAAPGRHWSASVQLETDKNYPGSLAEVRSYEQEGGDVFLAALRTGWLNYLAADYNKAEQSYTKAKQLQPAALNPALGLLNVAEAQQDPRKTVHAAEDVLHLEPTNYRAQMSLAGLHFAQKDYRKGTLEYRRVLTTYPDDPGAMSGAAWGAWYLGEKREALDGFKRLVGVSPAYPLAQSGLDLASGRQPAAN